MKTHTLIFILLIFVSGTAAQRKLSLEEAIDIARSRSVDAAVARNELKTAYWEYRNFKADLLPEISFNGTLPSYNKAYSAYQQSDGTYTYLKSDYMELDGALSVYQNIWLTGGQLSLTSSLNYLQDFASPKYKQYMSIPVSLTLSQPIFGVNDTKWKRKIEPVCYSEAKAGFIEATEKVALKAIDYFFQLLTARENLNIADQNLLNADKLYEVAKAKKNMGQISDNELLQLELSALKAKSSRTSSQSQLNAKMFQLRSFLGLNENENIEPIAPEPLKNILLDYKNVLDKALSNNSFVKNIRRRQLEAAYTVDSAKGNLRKINLYASVGYSGTNNTFSKVYDNLNSNNIVSVGISIPIIDWGKRKGQVKLAESNSEVVSSEIKKEQIDFNQNIFLLVEQFNNQAKQLDIAEQADIIAQKRYKTSIESFMIGKINTLDLNDAQVSKDVAKQDHIKQLYLYWDYYYQIRSIALWDYENNKNIDSDIERILSEPISPENKE